MVLPVLIPRVKKRSSRRRLRALRVRPMGESSLQTASGSAVHFGTRAALCERQSPQLPTKAVAPPVARPAGDRYAVGGYARGGCVCALCRHSAAVSATRGESRRLATPTKSAALLRLIKIAEEIAALFVGICTARRAPPKAYPPTRRVALRSKVAKAVPLGCCFAAVTRPV